MGVDGWAALVRLCLLTTIPTHTAALRNKPDNMKRQRKDPGLCFATEENGYSLLGCYRRPRSDSEVFGDDGYITLIPISGDQSTASTCLEGCAEAVPRGTTGDMYSHVAVSEGRYAVLARARVRLE